MDEDGDVYSVQWADGSVSKPCSSLSQAKALARSSIVNNPGADIKLLTYKVSSSESMHDYFGPIELHRAKMYVAYMERGWK